MTRSMTALVAPVLLCGLFGPVVLAQEASPAIKSSNQGAFASYDRGDATVYVSGNVLSGASPYSSASFSMVDNVTYATLAYCQSMNPSITVRPSGTAEVRFEPQVDALCPSDAPIVLACEPGEDSLISSTTYNVVFRGSGSTQHAHNKGWDLYGLRCSIVALGVEYQTSGNAYLMRYLNN